MISVAKVPGLRPLAALALLTSLLFAGWFFFESREPVLVSGIAFNSMPWQARLSALPEGQDAAAVQKKLQAILDDANGVLSTYQADSELMRFNRAPQDKWVAVSPLLFKTVAAALAVSAGSDGRYDITVGPLVNLWGFGPEAQPLRIPSDARIAEARARVGWSRIMANADKQALMRRGNVQLDLSSVGEGAAVDAMAAYLEAIGIRDYLVSVAGCSRVRGRRPDGKHWVMAIEQPDGSGGVQQVLRLENKAISTSGSYRNYHEIEGLRYSHTIDPATGRPITHHGVSVSVVGSSDTTLLDAWATALNVLGPEEGFELAEHRGLAAYFIFNTDKGPAVRYTSAFASYLPPVR